MLKTSGKKETALERKLREIEAEKRRVQEELKALNKAVKKGVVPPVAARKAPLTPSAESENQPSVPSQADVRSGQGAGGAATPVAGRQAPVRGDQRFAHYFSTGGLKAPLATRKARGVERNKTVFIIVMTCLLLYILYAVFF